MSLTPGGMRDGRDNILKLMEILGNPQGTLNIFHVTGSNGKGSVCQMISQVLWKKLGKKVGLFTSPHFITINERFQINGKPITDTVLEKYYAKVLKLSQTHSTPLSFFEIQVAVMVLYFVGEKVDYAVIEVGLGGTYDGTNIFRHPLACFITSITLEHTHLLGKSRKSILQNKLGILKKGTRLYTPLTDTLIKTTCKTLWVTLSTIKIPTKTITNLPGRHQQGNAQMVLKVLTDLGFDRKTILEGLQDIYNPGRFEWVTPTVLVDTANNEENIAILSKMVKGITKNKKDNYHVWHNTRRCRVRSQALQDDSWHKTYLRRWFLWSITPLFQLCLRKIWWVYPSFARDQESRETACRWENNQDNLREFLSHRWNNDYVKI